jgi:hypothetical protein
VAVADPDQAIYEFRQESKDLYKGYREGFSEEQVVDLDICHRSTRAICSAVSSLRALGKTRIEPAPDTGLLPAQNYVIVGTGRSLRQAALDLTHQHGISTGGLRILSHAKADSRKLSHGGIEPPNGSSLTERILTSIISLRTSDNATLRLASIRRLERCLLDLFAWPERATPGNLRSELEILEIDGIHLRTIVSRLLRASEDWASPDDCGKHLRSLVRTELGAMPVPLDE